MSHEDIVLNCTSTWKKLSQILHESLLIRIILSNVYYTFYLYLHFVFQFASDWLIVEKYSLEIFLCGRIQSEDVVSCQDHADKSISAVCPVFPARMTMQIGH